MTLLVTVSRSEGAGPDELAIWNDLRRISRLGACSSDGLRRRCAGEDAREVKAPVPVPEVGAGGGCLPMAAACSGVDGLLENCRCTCSRTD